MLYFVVITYVEFIIIRHYQDYVEHELVGTKTADGKLIVANTHQSCFLMFELCTFFFNYMAMILFLIFSRVFSFVTSREKAGFGGKMRYQVDFLQFCYEDVHWFQIWVIEVLMFAFALSTRNDIHNPTHSLIIQSVLIVSRLLVDFAIIFYIFFTNRPYPSGQVLIGLMILIPFLMSMSLLAVSFKELDRPSLYWRPYVYQLILIHVLAIGFVFVEYLVYPRYYNMWKRRVLMSEEIDKQIQKVALEEDTSPTFGGHRLTTKKSPKFGKGDRDRLNIDTTKRL